MQFDAGLGQLETKINYLKSLKLSINKSHLRIP
jgi:hypothetical protein